MLAPWIALLALSAPPPAPAEEDLPAIRKTKQLRVLVPSVGEEYLPRAGTPASIDRELAIELGQRLELETQFVPVDGYDQLIPALLDKKGDLIAAELTATESRKAQVAFTRALRVVTEMLVQKRGAPNPPKEPKDLAGRSVAVRASSAYAETLKSLAAGPAPGLKILAVPEQLDTDAIAYQLGQGKWPLTVIDSHTLKAISGYNPELEPLFPIASERPIGWAVRKTTPKLKAAVDAFLVEKAMTKHLEETFTGDLDGIKKRGVLRVLTFNNAINYFLFRGEPFGFEYELSKLLAKKLGLRLEIIVPPSHDLAIAWLVEGRGDLIAASFTRTPEREKSVAFTKPYMLVDEMLVRRTPAAPSAAAVKAPADLCKQKISLRRSSSYAQSVAALGSKLGCKIEIAEEPEDLETEEIIQKVAEGVLPLTVADSHILEVERAYRRPVEGVFPLDEKKEEIGFAVRPANKALLAALDDFVQKTYRGQEYNVARKKYFENPRQIAVALDKQDAKSGHLSPYDKILQTYGRMYDLDWRLLAAQAHAESRFDPKAKSWVGALGLFQVMPATGASLGFTNLEDPDVGAHAGIKYLDQLVKSFDPELEFKQRVRFALASYNAGMGHVIDARRLAAEQGLDPNRWFNNVEKTMLLLEKPKFAKGARHGYCRGSEPVDYVSRIQTSYDEYSKLLPP